MSRRARLAGPAAATIAAVAVLTACSSTGRSTTATSTPAGTSAPTTSAPAGGTTPRALRGEPTSHFACPPPTSPPAVASVPTSAVTAILVCSSGRVGGQPSSTTVVPSSPHFAPLLSALSAPDLPRSTGPCPLFVELPQPVVARTATEVLLVHIPVDGCSHYQAPASAAIHSAVGG